jgi:NAD(P)H-dependent FMN reductase
VARILLISGSLRAGSTNTALVRTAARLGLEGVEAVVYEGLAGLPAFNPDLDGDQLPHPADELRRTVRAADGLLFSTPEYAGALPGSFKNLLDWCVGDGQAGSIYEKPVGWVNTSARPDGASLAHDSLRVILGYVNATIVEAACVRIAVPHDAVGEDGLIDDSAIRAELTDVLRTLAVSSSPSPPAR